MNRNCIHYEYGNVAPSAYGAYCKKHQMFFYEKKSKSGKVILPDCSTCAECEVINGRDCESDNEGFTGSTSTSGGTI